MEDHELPSDESEEVLPQEDGADIAEDLPDLRIITVMFDNSSPEPPSLDLGETSPWVAITILQSAISTLELLIPTVDITYRGRVIFSAPEVLDSDSLEGLDDDEL